MKHLISVLWMLLVVLGTSGACFQSDVRQFCCPAACKVKGSSKWYQADQVLRSCAKSIGCKDVDGWTVEMHCSCEKAGAR
jgi:hypothetical protein